MRVLLALVVPVSGAGMVHAQPPIIVGPQGQYLGTLRRIRTIRTRSANPYGRYGSRFSADSINNPYSQWGSPYSPNSVTNPYATRGPRVWGRRP